MELDPGVVVKTDADDTTADSVKGGIIVVPPPVFCPDISGEFSFPATIVVRIELVALEPRLVPTVLPGFGTTVLQMLKDDGKDDRLLMVAGKLLPLLTMAPPFLMEIGLQLALRLPPPPLLLMLLLLFLEEVDVL